MPIVCYLFDVQYCLTNKHIFFPPHQGCEIHPTIAVTRKSLGSPSSSTPEAGSKLAYSFPGTFESKDKFHVSLVAQMVKNLPAVQETWV